MSYIDAFTKSAISTIAMVCTQELQRGKPFIHKESTIPDSVGICIGFTGQLVGHVVVRFSYDTAKAIASAMMGGMPIEELDEITISALSELGNMIMGNASTMISEGGLSTDITPPIVMQGAVTIRSSGVMPISIPLYNSTFRIELDMALREIPK